MSALNSADDPRYPSTVKREDNSRLYLMDPEALGREYDKKASHWQEPFLQANGLAQFEKAIRFTKNRGPALDIGCGSSGRFIDLLRKYGFVPEGLDVSERMIALAKTSHPEIQFYQADISKWIFPKKVASLFSPRAG
jgi:2-polyprenyl-3-methyl-5-hydroxy-6-metoxy-1,4-benzoquinol methylase